MYSMSEETFCGASTSHQTFEQDNASENAFDYGSDGDESLNFLLSQNMNSNIPKIYDPVQRRPMLEVKNKSPPNVHLQVGNANDGCPLGRFVLKFLSIFKGAQAVLNSSNLPLKAPKRIGTIRPTFKVPRAIQRFCSFTCI
jgi:hypothetical protein